jgi:antitoxin MazE
MKASVKKWGGSLAVRIPNALAEELRLREGSPVELKVEAGTLVLTPALPRYRLDELLVGITPKAMRQAWSWGPDKRREAVDE